jgi:N-acyl-D-amino-acid deacylase
MAENQHFDILIKNGSVFDGISDEPAPADIGINGDKISAVGNLAATADQTIDAGGMNVTPGFIDVHTHCDTPFMLSRTLAERAPTIPSVKGNWNYLYQGVTTVVSGNCGSGFADMDHWYNLLGAMGFGTNVYHLAPHGTIRLEVLGNDQPIVPSTGQLDEMKARLGEVMEMGAIGFSTGLIYPPGFLSETDELVEMAKTVAKYGGIYTSHIRGETGVYEEDGQRNVLKSINEALEIGRRAEIPVHISHLKINAPINGMQAHEILDLIDEARSEGQPVTADQYPYDASSTGLTGIIPNQFVESGGIKKEYKSGQGRQDLKSALAKVLEYLGPEDILISAYKASNEFQGKSILEVSEMMKTDPVEAFAQLVTDELPPSGVFFSQQMDIVRQVMKKEYVMTGSDGSTARKNYFVPHPRSYGTFPKKIRQFALDEGGIGLGATIRSMTSLPAEKFGMAGRGVIEPGAFADIAVIDLDRLADRATFLEPHQYADGIEYLLVNGVVSIDRGRATDGGGGRGLRRE